MFGDRHDPTKISMRGMFNREGDAAEYLQCILRDLDRGAPGVGLGDRGNRESVFGSFIQ